MTHRQDVHRCLVVVGSEVVEQQQPEQSRLLKRAIEVAGKLHAEVELFCVPQDAAPKKGNGLAEDAERCLAELKESMASQEIRISTDLCLDRSGSEALLQKITDAKPDLVFKAIEAPNFLLGLRSSVDWELVRNAESDLWFVKDSVAEVRKLITAIGTTESDGDVISDSDSKVLALGVWLAELLDAEQVTAHAYQLPKGVASYASYEPSMGVGNKPVIQPALESERAEDAAVQRAAEEHGKRIREFADSFEIDPEKIHLVRGDPAEILPQLANEIDANLIVLGARSLSRIERVLASVTAERALAETPCDILFVREVG